MLYRAFVSPFALTECTGEPGVGAVPRCERKVLYPEKLFGSLLVAGTVVLPQLEDKLARLKERCPVE